MKNFSKKCIDIIKISPYNKGNPTNQIGIEVKK